MSAVARFVSQRRTLSYALLLGLSVAAGWLAAETARLWRDEERLSMLQTDAGRRSVELMSQTLNGNLMGSVSLLGLIDAPIKREALGTAPVSEPRVMEVLESVGRSYDADGVFVVAASGIVGSSWTPSDKPSTGLNVKFRPYYQMAMQGMSNVYAAVSLARGDRSLYFAAPVYIDNTSGTDSVGAVVARTGLLAVDNLLRDASDIAVLLSPQGVVFASSKPEWVGHLAGAPTAQRLKAIRELKQFGNMFEDKEPALLPIAVDDGVHWLNGGRHVVARAPVAWNDPFGDWTLVLIEDLQRTSPLAWRVQAGVGTALLVLLLGGLLLKTLQGQHRQQLASEQLAAYSRRQQLQAEQKEHLATAALLLQYAKSQAEVAQTFLGETHRLFAAQNGVVYLIDPMQPDTLRLAASYACASAPPASLAVGEGLLGQCAVDRRVNVVTDIPAGQGRIHSGLGSTTPGALLIAPVLLQDTLLGVVELATLGRPGEEVGGQLLEMTRLLGMNLEILSRSAAAQDIVKAAVASEAAKAEQLRFTQALIDTIPYPVFYKGPDTRFIGFNHAYEAAFGVSHEELVGKHVLDLLYLPEADRIAYQAEDERVIAEAASVQREMRIPLADGKLHDTLYFASGFRRQDGQPGGLVGTFIDISPLRKAEQELARMDDVERFNQLAQGREQRILALKREVNALSEAAGQAAPYAVTLVEPVGDHDLPPHPDYRIAGADDAGPQSLAELIDIEELQTLFSAFCESVGVAAAIIDLSGKVLVQARWQRACTDFHRANPVSCARCIESDTQLATELTAGEKFTLYRCKNGMTDAAAPIIVEGRHLANVFIGQFHLGPPDLHFFAEQARSLGFDEADYLRAVREAPVLNEQRLPLILGFLSGFSQWISTLSLARRRADSAQEALRQQARLLHEERVAALSLAEDAERARSALERIGRESAP